MLPVICKAPAEMVTGPAQVVVVGDGQIAAGDGCSAGIGIAGGEDERAGTRFRQSLTAREDEAQRGGLVDDV